MPLFRRKPVAVEAVQLNWRNWNAVCDLLGGIVSPENPGRTVATYSDTCGEQTTAEAGWIELTIPRLEGNLIAWHGDWIIKGVKGEFYPCKRDVFAEIYEPAE
jgi:hypothetical protein